MTIPSLVFIPTLQTGTQSLAPRAHSLKQGCLGGSTGCCDQAMPVTAATSFLSGHGGRVLLGKVRSCRWGQGPVPVGGVLSSTGHKDVIGGPEASR